jgi:hypothetical protein
MNGVTRLRPYRLLRSLSEPLNSSLSYRRLHHSNISANDVCFLPTGVAEPRLELVGPGEYNELLQDAQRSWATVEKSVKEPGARASENQEVWND